MYKIKFHRYTLLTDHQKRLHGKTSPPSLSFVTDRQNTELSLLESAKQHASSIPDSIPFAKKEKEKEKGKENKDVKKKMKMAVTYPCNVCGKVYSFLYLCFLFLLL